MNIFSTKQKQLEMLQKQMESLQQEITQFHEEHPEYRKTLDAIEKERSKLIEIVNKEHEINVPNFLTLICKWAGEESYPDIIDYKFLLEENVSEFLEQSLEESLTEIFDSNVSQIKEFSAILDDIDQKVSKFNSKVEKAYEKFNEDFLLELKIQAI
jgi:prefoldin subunit 5